MTLDEIRRLSVAERVQLVEDIWDSLTEIPESLPLTTSLKSELDRRLAEHEAHPEDVLPWDEVRRSLIQDK